MLFKFSVSRILGRKVGRAEGGRRRGRQAWRGDDGLGWRMSGCHAACYTIHMLKWREGRKFSLTSCATKQTSMVPYIFGMIKN